MSTPYVTAPPTTAYTVVFPFDDAAKKFDSGFYSPGLTDGRASFEEINQVLDEINRTRKPITSQILTSLCCFLVAFILILFGFIYFEVSADRNSDLIVLGIVGFLVGIFGSIIGFIMRVVRLNKVMKDKCQDVLNRTNQTFASRGLRWHLPIHFPRWIELWKDYQGQVPGGQPIYMPPVNQQPYYYPPGVQGQGHGQGQGNNNNMYTRM